MSTVQHITSLMSTHGKSIGWATLWVFRTDFWLDTGTPINVKEVNNP